MTKPTEHALQSGTFQDTRRDLRDIACARAAQILKTYVDWTAAQNRRAVVYDPDEVRIRRAGSDPTVPSDVRCWILSVQKVLLMLNGVVNRKCSAAMILRLVHGMPWTRLAAELKCSRAAAKQNVEIGSMLLLIEFARRGLNDGPKE